MIVGGAPLGLFGDLNRVVRHSGRGERVDEGRLDGKESDAASLASTLGRKTPRHFTDVLRLRDRMAGHDAVSRYVDVGNHRARLARVARLGPKPVGEAGLENLKRRRVVAMRPEQLEHSAVILQFGLPPAACRSPLGAQ